MVWDAFKHPFLLNNMAKSKTPILFSQQLAEVILFTLKRTKIDHTHSKLRYCRNFYYLYYLHKNSHCKYPTSPPSFYLIIKITT